MATSSFGFMFRRQLMYGFMFDKNILSCTKPFSQLPCRLLKKPLPLQFACAQHFASISSLVSRLHQNFQSRRLASTLIPTLQPPNSSDVIDTVSGEISQGRSRLFAVIQISGRQHKVTTGDLVLLQTHIPADVGDRIRLEKVLLVGGDNFSLIGKPLLSLDTVRIEATVIEKTVSQKKIIFKFKRRKRYKRYKEIHTDQTVLRINSIEVSPKLR